MSRLEAVAYWVLAIVGLAALLRMRDELNADPLVIVVAALAWLTLLVAWASLRRNMALCPVRPCALSAVVNGCSDSL